MNWIGLLINIVALFAGFFIYIGIYHTRLGDKLDKYKYPVLLAILIIVCIIGGFMKFVFSNIL